MINKIISHYKVIDKLGEGGMGVLYLAEDLELNRKAALKFLPPDMINDPDTNLRFKREAQSAGSLSHPNIVTIYDVGVYENKTFIAMEYVEGKTLREMIKTDELIIERITDISVQICEGLNEAHSKGITHRDIKPENILIDEKGKVKIVDFGLAKIKNTSRGITKQDSTVGTLKYMSPEQIRNQNVDHRSDIWSFGVILYEMITGKYPFKGEHDASLFYSVINQTPEPLARYKANIAEGYQRIIDKSLDKDPETRYQHIDELLSDLRRERKESGEHRIDKRKTKKLRTKIPIIISAIAFVVLSAAVIIYLLNNPARNVKPPKHTQLTFDGNIYFYINNSFLDKSQISPDGQFIAYILNKKDGKSIYIKDNYGEQAIEIYKGLLDITSLKWSPSGNEILFSAILNDSARFTYIIPRLGGKVQEFNFFTFSCWSPDENLIAGISSKHILLIKRESGKVVKKIDVKGFKGLRDIDWSPIGNNLVFIGFDEKSDNYAIGVIKTDGTRQKKIFETSGIFFSPLWSSDGGHIYYLQGNEMTRNLMKVEISIDEGASDDEPKIIQTGLQAYGFSITRDDKKICYTKFIWSSNLGTYIYDKKKQSFYSKKLTEGTSLYNCPAISPDGNKIAYGIRGNIFVMSVDGDSIKQLTFLNSECRSPSWSPDGKEIAFISKSNLFTIPIKGGSSKLIKNITVGFSAVWGSDLGILYNDSTNHNLYLYNLSSKKNKLISKENNGQISYPRTSPDNSQIAVHWNRYIDNEVASGLWVISLKDSSQKLLFKGDLIYPLGWSQNSEEIYATNFDKVPLEILKVSVKMNSTEQIYVFPSGKIYPWVISCDETTIVCTEHESTSDVWMIENFDSDVEQDQ